MDLKWITTKWILDEDHQLKAVESLEESVVFPHEKCIVAKTLIGQHEISTVFTRVAQPPWDENGTPCFFETMGMSDCTVLDRYRTWAQAQEGHDRYVKQLRTKLGIDVATRTIAEQVMRKHKK